MTKTTYYNTRTKETTESATIALKWQRSGDALEIWRGKTTRKISGAEVETRADKDYRENRERCKRIADDIDDYIEGRVFKCPECGEIITVDDDREKHLCSCGYVDDIDEFEQLGIYDFLEDVYGIEYRIGSDKALRSVQIMVACGGPNIYLDTSSQKVELYWWGDSAYYPLSSNAVAALDEWAEELYSC